MAKTKTKKVEKSSKITNEELNELQEAITAINKAQMQVGVFQTNIHQLLHHIAGMNDKLVLLQEKFNKQYGTADVNIDDGTINYHEQTN